MFVKDKPTQPWHRLLQGGMKLNDGRPITICGIRPGRKGWFYTKESIPEGGRECHNCVGAAYVNARGV